MKSLESGFLEQQAVPLEMAGTLRVLGEYRGRQDLWARQAPQVLETLRQIALVQSTESSNRIEGVVVAEDRLKALVGKTTAPRDRPEAEVVGYRDALARVHTAFTRIEVTPATILNLHADLFRKTDLPAGVWKRRDNTIEERTADGRWVTRFVPVSAAETPRFVEELCARFNRLCEEGRVDRLLLIHAFVLDFLCIHPFTDGNGRVSRLLTVLLLHRAGYEVGRYVSLEKLIEESKETYYEVLQKSSEGWREGRRRLRPWWEYTLGVLLASYKELESRAAAVRSRRGAKTSWVQDAVKHLPSEFTMGEVARACPAVSRPMIRVVLEGLRREGRLEVVGTGRGALWRKRGHFRETR